MSQARPREMWMIAAKAARHEWLMYWTAGDTRKSARNAFADQFGTREIGLSVFKKRMKEGGLRYARVFIQEIAP